MSDLGITGVTNGLPAPQSVNGLTSNPTVTPGVTDSPADAAAIAAYPQMAWALADPELGPILRLAASQGWDSNRLAGALENTNWYKNHDQAARAWADLSANDPAEAQQRINAQTIAIRNAANTMGVNLSSSQLTDLATQSLTNGWDQTQLTNVLGGFLPTYRNPNTPGNLPVVKGLDGMLYDTQTGRRAYYGPNGEPGSPSPFAGAQSWKQADGTLVYYKAGDFNYGNAGADPNQQRGDTGYTIDQMKADAANMLVPVSDGTLSAWAKQIAQGAATEQGFKAYLQTTALSLYPTLNNEINQGLTVQQIVDPYKQLAASTLEIDPNTVNFEDPQWAKFLQTVDPQTGSKQMMPLWQAKQVLMSDPQYGYQNTTQAKTQAATIAQTIGRLFGATTGGTTSGI